MIFILYLSTEWSTWLLIFIWYLCTEWSMWLPSCQNAAVQFDIICSLILCVIWYCLHSFILFFLFNLNCASTSLYIFRLEHALLILHFLHYIVIENNDIFQKETFVMNMMLPQHLVSPDYSSCVSQIYISVCSFIAFRKIIISTSHIYHVYVLL